MRAWVVEGQGEPAEVLRLVDDRPVPEPGPGQVRLRVLATGIGLPDVFLCRGTYAFAPPLPFVAGQEVCGVVEACGEGVEVELGTRLLGATDFPHGHGGFAERFRFKGRYEQMMAGLPVKLITLPQPGLYGAAAAFAKEHP